MCSFLSMTKEDSEDQRTKMWELGYSHGFLNLPKQEKIRLPKYRSDYENGFENGEYDLKLHLFEDLLR